MNNKVETEWEYEYHENTKDIPSQGEMQQHGKSYNPPEYFFVIDSNGKRFGDKQESKLLEFKDWIELALYDGAGNQLRNIEYRMILPDGSQRNGKLDANGYAKEDNIPPGRVTTKWNLKNVPLF